VPSVGQARSPRRVRRNRRRYGTRIPARPATPARATQLRAKAWGIRVGRDSDQFASLRGAALAALVAGATAIDDL
jgi:hypothetical protein